VIAGGIIAAYVMQQNQRAAITPADGALVGLLAGLIGAIVAFLVSIPIDIVTAPMEESMVQRALDMAGNMPPEVRATLENMRSERAGGGIAALIFFRIVGLILSFFVGSVFSTIGGLLGAVLFARRGSPDIIDIPPSS
jgi:uncharacterized protein YqgC (DUF456 family)